VKKHLQWSESHVNNGTTRRSNRCTSVVPV
jgi:hypothetical protein